MELLIRIVDKVSNDPDKNKQLTKAGDVITFKPDGSSWGLMELKNPEWRIIQVDITKEEAEALVAPELPPDLDKDYILRKRQMKIDLESLDGLSGGQVLREKRITAIEDAEVAFINKRVDVYSKDNTILAAVAKVDSVKTEKDTKTDLLDIEKAEIKVKVAQTELELKKQSLLKEHPELSALKEDLKQAIIDNCVHCVVDPEHIRSCMQVKK